MEEKLTSPDRLWVADFKSMGIIPSGKHTDFGYHKDFDKGSYHPESIRILVTIKISISDSPLGNCWDMVNLVTPMFPLIKQMGMVLLLRKLRKIRQDFVLFAERCFKSFGDRVKYWTTINEPNMFAESAYVWGVYPPAHCSPPFGNCSVGNSDTESLIVVHNMLLAHAKAVKLYREQFQSKQGGSIGIVAHAHMFEPLRDVESDRQAVNRDLAFMTGWIFDPLVFGDYPPEMRHYHRSELPRFSTEETEYLKGSIDFIGLNHYSTMYAKDCSHSSCALGGDHFIKGFVYTCGERDGIPIGEPTSDHGFFVVPRGMEMIVDYVSKRYNNMPIYVTENGYSPPLTETNLLHDVNRVRFHNDYLAFLARAIRKGADVRGYFVWSLMDNFEWGKGYSATYGLYYVDRRTMKRIPKLSAEWFRRFLSDRSSARINEQRSVIDM